jgi:hypothetical protein
VNGTGTTKDNGATNHYTGYINCGEYSSISLGNAHRTDDANFIVEVMCQDTEDDDYEKHAEVTVESDLGDGALKVFCDDYILAVESGIGTSVSNEYTKNFDEGSQQAVQLTGEKSWEHWEKHNSIGAYCHESLWPTPHEEPENMESWPNRYGMNMWRWGSDVHTQLNENIANGMRLYTRLYDDDDFWEDPLPPYGQGTKNRIYARRRGGYFCSSYGGKELATGILNSGEYAMDLTKNTGHFTWKLFPTGRIELENSCTNSGGLNLTGASALCTAAWAILAPYSTSWAIAFGTASAVFAYIDSLDFNIDAYAESVVRIRYVVDRYPYDGSASAHDETGERGDPITKQDTGTYQIAKDITLVNYDWVAGEAYTLFVELESCCSAKSLFWSALDVSSESIFRCTGDAQISAWDDFHSMYVSVRWP